MNAARRFGILFLLIITLLGSWGSAGAQSSGDTQYFPETGHIVKGEFLRFFKQAPKPLLVYGYPITEQLKSVDGKTVQYFQRARFELRPELPKDERVQLTELGQELYEDGSQQLDIDNPAACESFSSGYRVCLAFLEFYKASGGAAQYGDPISPFEFHENLIVQYFEKARFEWRADRPEGQRVVLTDLGHLYFDQLAEDQSQLKPITPVDATITDILSISTRAFVSKAITRSSGQQTVYIIVQSQTHQTVSGANGKATIHFSNGHSEDYFFTTNRSGFGSFNFKFADQTQGELIRIDVIVTYQGLSATTTTSFRIWF